MKAKYELSQQQNNDKRIVLKDCIPLQTPLSLQFELSSACNFKCKFCMHGNAELIKKGVYKIGNMEFGLFKKIVDDLKGFPEPLKFTSLQCRGESLLNPQIVDMIRYLKEARVSNEIVLNTNASLLTEELSQDIVDAGLDVLRISVEAVTEDKYLEITGVRVDFQKLLANIKYFYENKKQCHVYAKIIDCDMTEEEKKLFFDTFGDTCDSLYIERPIDIWKDAGLDKEIFKENRWTTKVNCVEVCPRLFFAYAVHFDGTVVSCDQDWKEETPIGNAEYENMMEIWNGEKFNEIRYNHLIRKGNKYPRCEGCAILKESLPNDNLDMVKQDIFKYYKDAACKGEERNE